MKIKSLILRLSYVFRQRIHGKNRADNMPPELAKLKSEREGAESVIRDILRWAEDGGKRLDLGNRTVRPNPDAVRKQANE